MSVSALALLSTVLSISISIFVVSRLQINQYEDLPAHLYFYRASVAIIIATLLAFIIFGILFLISKLN